MLQWAIRSLLSKFVNDKNMVGLQRLNGGGLRVIQSITMIGIRYSLTCGETYKIIRVLRLRGGVLRIIIHQMEQYIKRYLKKKINLHLNEKMNNTIPLNIISFEWVSWKNIWVYNKKIKNCSLQAKKEMNDNFICKNSV